MGDGAFFQRRIRRSSQQGRVFWSHHKPLMRPFASPNRHQGPMDHCPTCFPTWCLICIAALAGDHSTPYLSALTGSALLVTRTNSGGLKQLRGSWLCPGRGLVTWRPPVFTGPREFSCLNGCGGPVTRTPRAQRRARTAQAKSVPCYRGRFWSTLTGIVACWRPIPPE
mgnify:CR=1 FL=1